MPDALLPLVAAHWAMRPLPLHAAQQHPFHGSSCERMPREN